jgi:hypothetical protein
MNRICGFLVEPDGELVFLGDQDSSLPPIHLDDLAIAFRHAYQVSAVYSAPPGCSIDLMTDTEDPWRIQKTVVLGMPAYTTMAARHIAIDYELKRVSAGIVLLEDGMPSLYDLIKSKFPLCAKSLNAEPQTTVAHRFWFYPRYPSPPRFLAEAGIVLVLKSVEVQLLTEQEFLTQTGHRTGSAPAGPQAERFAQQITDLLATNPPQHYAHLRNDFRLIEIGKLLSFRQIPAASLRYLLQEYPLTEVPVPAFVGGVRREEQSEVVCETRITEQQERGGKRIESSEQIRRYHLLFQGGVEARIELTQEQFDTERPGVLDYLRQRVRASRPSASVLRWSISYQ